MNEIRASIDSSEARARAAFEKSPPRRVDLPIDAERVPVEWYREDAFLSLFWDALSLLFPEGEKFFVDSVRAHRDHVVDPELAARVKAFIGQEALHSKEHRAFNRLFEVHGIDNAPELERELGALLGFVKNTLPPKTCLAATCALEHMTAILGEQLLSVDCHREAIDDTMKGLWLWHALEEVEHKSVAYDVYQSAGGGYALRTSIMAVTTIIFFAVHVTFHSRMLARKGLLHRPLRWRAGLRYLFGDPGLLPHLVGPYLQYYRPGFHPDDRDHEALIAEWRERLFGATGLLRAAA